MVERMKKFAKPEDKIEAHSVNEVPMIYKNYDVVILGPQVRLQLDDIKKACSKGNVPVDIIDITAYGRMDGQRVYKQAADMYKKGADMK